MIYVVSLQNTGKYTKNFNNFYRPAPLLFQNMEIKPHFPRTLPIFDIPAGMNDCIPAENMVNVWCT